jgi:hypothetical protein
MQLLFETFRNKIKRRNIYDKTLHAETFLTCHENRGKEKLCPVMNRKSKKINFGIAEKFRKPCI